MKAALLIILFGLVTLPIRDAWVVNNPSLPLMDPSKGSKTNDSNPVVVSTDTALYEKYVCIGNLDGLRLIVPGSCSNYYECFNGVATVNSCGNLTPYYDPINQTCVAESSCVDKDIVVSGGPVGCTGVCCGKTAGLYVDPSDETQFYFCNKNVGILHSCCNGEQFNPITKACDVPANCP